MTRSSASIYNALIFASRKTVQRTVIEQLVRVRPVNQLLKIQSFALPVIMMIFWLWQGHLAAMAAGFGAAIGVLNTLLTKWHLIRTASKAAANPVNNISGVYRCVAERWFVTIVMFATGFVVFKSAAMALLSGFIAMQFVVLIGNTRQA